MGRIVTQIRVENADDSTQGMEFSALVDTGAAYLTLPMEWLPRFGEFRVVRDEEVLTATGDTEIGKLVGPVMIQVSQFRKIFTEMLFINMKRDEDNRFEPLLGYIPMEQSGIAVDMLGHRLLAAKYIDVK